MADQVYRVEELRNQVLDLLRKQEPMKVGAITMALGVPLWAVFAAVESATTAKLVTYVPGFGYELVHAPVKGEAV